MKKYNTTEQGVYSLHTDYKEDRLGSLQDSGQVGGIAVSCMCRVRLPHGYIEHGTVVSAQRSKVCVCVLP